MAVIKVIVVDDSAVVRQVISGVLSKDRSIHVTAAVADPVFAIQRMQADWPDVIVLDLEMPRMDGITFLKKIMSERPTPVVICSSLTLKGAAATMQALSAGAVAIVAKPKVGIRNFLLDDSADLVEVVKAAAHANTRNLRLGAASGSAEQGMPTKPRPEHVVAIGTSTGGTQALEAVLSALPVASPGIVIVQHMPEKFTTAFAQRLDGLCRIEVRELFSSTPARRKFLKVPATEAGHVAQLVSRFALARAEIGFELRQENREAMVFAPATLRERIRRVLGTEVAAEMRLVDGDGVVRLSGFVTHPHFSLANARSVLFFVNGRLVRDRLLQHALMSAYATLIPSGRYPAAVLFLEVAPERVDVNVHPTKLEVRFRDGHALHGAIGRAIRGALRSVQRPCRRGVSGTV